LKYNKKRPCNTGTNQLRGTTLIGKPPLRSGFHTGNRIVEPVSQLTRQPHRLHLRGGKKGQAFRIPVIDFSAIYGVV